MVKAAMAQVTTNMQRTTTVAVETLGGEVDTEAMSGSLIVARFICLVSTQEMHRRPRSYYVWHRLSARVPAHCLVGMV